MKKWSLAHICAYISLAISITLLVLWCCNVGGFTVVSLDSFIGVIVALLAIVVTMAVGWQIYNSIELKNKIEELNKLKDNLIEQENNLEQLRLASQHAIGLIWGDNCLESGSFLPAFRHYITALDSAMQLLHPVNIDKILSCMETIEVNIKKGETYSEKRYNEILETDKSIRTSNNYKFIDNRYEKIYNSIITKIKVDEEQ